MPFELPELPYASDALEPHISRETLEYHYGKHHRGYVDKLNSALAGTEFEKATLEDVIRNASDGLFNNAAQAWNHAFYWECLSPQGGGDPADSLASALARDFGSVEKFRKQFSEQAATLFGSGWAWLVQRDDGKLSIEQTANADTPVAGTARPLLTCDVWEHAYYIDYRNARKKYIDAFWKLINWDHVASGMR